MAAAFPCRLGNRVDCLAIDLSEASDCRLPSSRRFSFQLVQKPAGNEWSNLLVQNRQCISMTMPDPTVATAGAEPMSFWPWPRQNTQIPHYQLWVVLDSQHIDASFADACNVANRRVDTTTGSGQADDGGCTNSACNYPLNQCRPKRLFKFVRHLLELRDAKIRAEIPTCSLEPVKKALRFLWLALPLIGEVLCRINRICNPRDTGPVLDMLIHVLQDERQSIDDPSLVTMFPVSTNGTDLML